MAGRHVLINPPGMSWHPEAGAHSALKRRKVAGLLFCLVRVRASLCWGEGWLSLAGPAPLVPALSSPHRREASAIAKQIGEHQVEDTT